MKASPITEDKGTGKGREEKGPETARSGFFHAALFHGVVYIDAEEFLGISQDTYVCFTNQAIRRACWTCGRPRAMATKRCGAVSTRVGVKLHNPRLRRLFQQA